MTDLSPDAVKRAAALLLSEHGENPEYDRALAELVADLLGIPDNDDALAMLRTRKETSMPDPIPLTDEQKYLMDTLMGAIQDGEVALLSCLLDDLPVAVALRVVEDGEAFNMQPLAIMVTEDLYHRLTPPEDEDGNAPEPAVAPREAQVAHEGGSITVGMDDA